MNTTQSDFFQKLESFSNWIASILSFKGIVIIAVVFFGAIAAVLFFQSFYRTSLLAAAASGGEKKFRKSVLFSAIADAVGKLLQNILVLLPILAGIIAALAITAGVMKIVISINDFVEREKRIHELSVAIKYLDQSQKVMNVSVTSIVDGLTRLRITYSASDPDNAVPPVKWRKDIEIPGNDIFFDCMVLNFTYSEITSGGKQANIAIPYRVFSNIVSANEGRKLNEITEIPEEDDYGFIPTVYKERLTQLLTDEKFAKEMGVRSVNGSAPHRIVNAGDKFTVRIEAVGGVTISD